MYPFFSASDWNECSLASHVMEVRGDKGRMVVRITIPVQSGCRAACLSCIMTADRYTVMNRRWEFPISCRTKRGPVAIPWITALYVFRKVLPVVLDNAPDLLKTLERRRTSSRQTESATTDSSLALFRERIEAQEQLMATQMEQLTRLQETLRATRRSLAITWMVLAAAVLLGVSIAAALILRS